MEVDEIRQVRKDKLESLLKEGIAPFGCRFETSSSISQILSDFKEDNKVRIAGRKDALP